MCQVYGVWRIKAFPIKSVRWILKNFNTQTHPKTHGNLTHPYQCSGELLNHDIKQISVIEGFLDYHKSTEILLLSIDNSDDEVFSHIGL